MKVQDISWSFAAYARPSMLCSFTLIHWDDGHCPRLAKCSNLNRFLEPFQINGVRMRTSETGDFYCAMRPGRPGKCKGLFQNIVTKIMNMDLVVLLEHSLDMSRWDRTQTPRG
jgi:hypothetical protein